MIQILGKIVQAIFIAVSSIPVLLVVVFRHFFRKTIDLESKYANAPEMNQATAEARASLYDFEQYYNYPEARAYVKVALIDSKGETKSYWGIVNKVTEDYFHLKLTAKKLNESQFSRNQLCLKNEILDWVVKVPNLKNKGGFTMKVLFQLCEEEYGKLSEEFQNEKDKYSFL